MQKLYPVFYNISSVAKRACLLLPITFCFNAHAQTDTTKKLKQVDIKATVAPVLQTLTPAQQFNAKDIIRNSAFNVADAIRNFAGVNIKDYGGIGGLKTVSVRSLGANHTAVMFDGIQLNDAQNGQIDLSKFNLANVQEITLYNGQPATLLQPARAFASASVLNIKTIQPALTAERPYRILAGMKGGSFGLVNPYAQWQQRISNSWSLIANVNYINANGQYKYKNNNDGSDTLAVRRNGDVRSFQTDAALYWAKGDSDKLNIRFNYYDADRGLPGGVILYNAKSSERLENNDAFVQASYQHIWKNSLSLLLNGKLSQLKTRYLDPDFLNQQGFLDQHYNQREAYQSAAIAYNLTPNWEASFAVDASFVKMDADIYNYAYPSRFTLLNVLGTQFTKGKWRLQGSLLLTGITESVKKGEAPQQQSVFTPTLMATFKPFDSGNLQLRGFYKNIFRAATLDEIYFYAIIPRAIKPEFVDQYDIGATYSRNLDNLLDHITLTADAYYNHIKNKILAVPGQNPAIFSFSNLGRVDVKGIDVGIKTQTKQRNGWYGALNANYTYQEALDVSDPASSTYLEQIPYTPRHTLALNAGLNYKNAGIYFNHILSSPRYYTGNNTPEYYVAGYSISDASAQYKIITGRIPAVLSFEINNLFNKNYQIIRSYPMPGRSYRLSIQLTI